MSWLLSLVGLFLGAFFCGAVFDGSAGWMGALFGTLVGFALARIQLLRNRVAALEGENKVLGDKVTAARDKVRGLLERLPQE